MKIKTKAYMVTSDANISQETVSGPVARRAFLKTVAIREGRESNINSDVWQH